MSLKRSMSSTSTVRSTPLSSESFGTAIEWPWSASTSRLGKPVSGSCRAWSRMAPSALVRAAAAASTFATATTKFTSSSANSRGVRLPTPITPAGESWPGMGTSITLIAWERVQRSGISKRASRTKSSQITVSWVTRAKLTGEDVGSVERSSGPEGPWP